MEELDSEWRDETGGPPVGPGSALVVLVVYLSEDFTERSHESKQR